MMRVVELFTKLPENKRKNDVVVLNNQYWNFRNGPPITSNPFVNTGETSKSRISYLLLSRAFLRVQGAIGILFWICTWCSSAKRENYLFFLHLLRVLMNIELINKDSRTLSLQHQHSNTNSNTHAQTQKCTQSVKIDDDNGVWNANSDIHAEEKNKVRRCLFLVLLGAGWIVPRAIYQGTRSSLEKDAANLPLLLPTLKAGFTTGDTMAFHVPREGVFPVKRTEDKIRRRRRRKK